MKKLVAAMMALGLVACSSTPKFVCTFPDSNEVAPEWMCPESQEERADMILATGSYEASKASYAHRERMAMQNARANLVLEVNARMAVSDSSSEGTERVGNKEQVVAADGSSGTTVTEAELAGTRMLGRVSEDSGRLWVLVGIPQSQLLQARERVLD
ncbi:LPP20 family lipoprotein [Ferrimonas pelagia]|uniref:Lipoprotein LPP20-like domain-containing protein n=1 Tax=Ferrimonas pelagia TaxID=1177826 RepID=A0ABP9E9J9_9GAMM